MFGLSDAEIAAVLHGDSGRFSAQEQALLLLADALADTPANVSEELYRTLRAHFSEEALIELAADAAQENFRARWNRVFDVGSDSLYCAIPDR